MTRGAGSTNKKRIGGWTRLWVVITLLWGAVVGSLTVGDYWPSRSTQLDRNGYDKLMAKLSEKSLKLMADDPDQGKELRVERVGNDLVLWDSRFLTLSDGKTIRISAATPERELEELKRDYEAAHRAVVHEMRVEAIFDSLILWLVPALSTLGIGMAIGWVYRGFKGDQVGT